MNTEQKWPPPTINEIAESLYCSVKWVCKGLCVRLIPRGPTVKVTIAKEKLKEFLEWAETESLKAIGFERDLNNENIITMMLRGPQVKEKTAHFVCF